MTLSTIIPTKKRHEELLNTIKNVLLQTHLPDEIIIVDQNISTEIKDAAISLLNSKKIDIAVKYIHDPQITGLTQARNIAIKKNESDILLFLDDDVLLEKDFIFNILEIYRKYPDIYGVSGIITNTQMGLIGKIYYKFFWLSDFTDQRSIINTDPRYINTEYIPVSKLPGGLTGYRKEVFEEILFDENFIDYGLSEDFDFSYRVSRKYKIVITPRAKLQHVGSNPEEIDHKKISKNTILSMNYFYKKNVEKTFYNIFCYVWWNIGCIVYGMLIVILKQRVDILSGYAEGWKELMKGRRSEFIKSFNGKD